MTNVSENKKNIPIKGQHLFRLLKSGYAFLNLKGVVLESNTALTEMLGLGKHELEGKSLFHLCDDSEIAARFVEQVLAEDIVRHFSIDLCHQDGSIFHVHIDAQVVVNPEDNSPGIECILTCSSDAMREQQFDETLRNVTGGIAHIINNQMGAVIGTAGLMKLKLNGDSEMTSKLERITQSGINASDVAKKLVEYAESIELKERYHLNITDVLNAVMEKYTGIDTQPPRKILFDVSASLPEIKGDFAQLVRLLSIFLDNAIEATQEHETIVIKCRQKALLKGQVSEDYVMLSVADYGHGMDKETQVRIFEPFFSTRFMGRGMSLAHALKIIKVHEGRIHVKTGVGQGSIFKVYFPLIKSASLQ